jgi:hypothetical protein
MQIAGMWVRGWSVASNAQPGVLTGCLTCWLLQLQTQRGAGASLTQNGSVCAVRRLTCTGVPSQKFRAICSAIDKLDKVRAHSSFECKSCLTERALA